jgi:hypothetical protein
MKIEIFVKIFDLEKDLDALVVESPEIVFTVRVVGGAEIVENRDSLDEALDCLFPQGGDAWRDDGAAAGKVLSKLVVERANSIRIRDGHGWVSVDDVGLRLERRLWPSGEI